MRFVPPIGLVFAVLMLVLPACDGSDLRPEEPVSVQLSWKHQAQFAGFYAALDQGFYADERLKVTLRPRSKPSIKAIDEVLSGRVDFGVGSAPDLLKARADGHPVKALAAVYQRSPITFITLAGSGIRRPADFPGRTMGTMRGASNSQYRAMMEQAGEDPDSVTILELGYGLDPLLDGSVDILPAYHFNEPQVLRRMGNELNLIHPSDYGVHAYGDTVFTTDRMVEERPDLVRRFMRATLNGWRWAVDHPSEAGLLALNHDESLNADHQIAMMVASLPLVFNGQAPVGGMDRDHWQGYLDILVGQKVVAAPFDVSELYTTAFIVDE